MPPERADLVLSTDVPDVELDVLVGYGLDVEADSRDRGDVLVELEFVEDGCKEEMFSMCPGLLPAIWAVA